MGAITGKEYLQRIRECAPESWVGAEVIKDPTTHPATRGAVHEIARLYDLQFDERYRDFMLFPSPDTGDLVGTQFLIPKTPEDLLKRRKMHKLWADATFGWMGRTTDFIAAMMVAWNGNADFFGEYADNVRNYFKYIRENDCFLTHVLVDPPVDRGKPPSQQPDPFTYLGVVRETDKGLIVRGAKMLATAGPYADEMVVWPFSLRSYGEEDKRYAIAFAIPTNTPGLRFICREPYAIGNRFDHPLATRFDEMDAVAVFNDVLVPWERVFINQDWERVAQIWKVNSNAFTGHQTSIRLWSKLQFIAGLLRRATQMVQTDRFPHVRDMIGEITTYIELTKAAVIASEAEAERDEQGMLWPNVRPLFAIRNSGNRWYPRVVEIIHLVLAGSLMYQPAHVNVFDSPIREDIEKYYRGANVTAEERVKIFKTAADVAVNAFGGRHVLYERFYAGDPMFLRINTQFLQYDWEEPLRLADEFLQSFSAEEVLKELREAQSEEQV